jgi:SHS2 domain-containing protein
MGYEVIEHTADMSIQFWGKNPEALFAAGAHALFDLITDPKRIHPSAEIEIHVTGDDWPDLMVNWLRELLYVWAGKEMLVKAVQVLSVSEHRITARAALEPYDPQQHEIRHEIKAVTYHQIEVEQTPEEWRARVVFDM